MMNAPTITLQNVNELFRSVCDSIPKEGVPMIVVRRAFTNPIEWRAANELIRRGSFFVRNRSRGIFWEWMEIAPKKP